MRVTTETLSRVTDLVAAVSAPPLHTATIKHVEVLLLQPQVALVVVISSSGAVTKRAFTFDEPVDAGLADWAASYLNERLAGMELGALTLRGKLDRSGAVGDRARVPGDDRAGLLRPRRDDRADPLHRRRGAPALGQRFDDLSEVNDLMRMLERRVTLLSVLRSALGEPAVYLRIGAREPGARAALGERRRRELRPRSPHARRRQRDRPGADGLPQAIQSVRAAARALSGSSKRSTSERRPPDASMPRDYYEVLGVAREARRRRDQEGVPPARARAAPGRQQARPRGRGEVQGGRRGIRGAERPRAARHLRPLRPRGAAHRAASQPNFGDFGNISDIFEAFFGGGDPFGRSSAAARAGPERGPRRRGARSS